MCVQSEPLFLTAQEEQVVCNILFRILRLHFELVVNLRIIYTLEAKEHIALSELQEQLLLL